MKKQTFLVLILATVLLTAYYGSINIANAQTDFNAYSGNPIPDDQIDGVIGTEWDDAGHVEGVALSPQGTADVWTKNDGTFLYIGVRFTADSNDPWVGIQLGGNSCMESGTDLALFGNNLQQFNKDGYADSKMAGEGAAKPDDTQDGKGALNVTSQNIVTLELKKPLNSGDTAGNDINWTQNETKTLIIVWNSNTYGSSGGTTSHFFINIATVRTLLVNSNTLPQGGNSILTNFDTTTAVIVIIVVVVAVIAIFFGVRRVRKPGAVKEPKTP